MSAADLSLAMPVTATAPKGRILCVDDEPNILRALSWLLQKDFDVVTAGDGREALDLVRADDFDVVISDQRMPGMSGVDFLQEVKAIAPRAMRILLTGYSDLDAVLRSVNEAEIFRFVTKPWNVMELPRIVAQAAEIARESMAADSTPLAPPLSPDACAAKVLVLDDDLRTHAAVELYAGDLARVVHVTTVADAIHQLQDTGVGALVAETRVGNLDVTRLICLLKQRYPHVMSIVLTEQAGTDTAARLVNQGQVFRFLPKPINPGRLRDSLGAALEKSRKISREPALGRRHEVEMIPEDELASLQADMDAALPGKGLPGKIPPPLLGGPVGRLFRRLFPSGGCNA